MEDRVIVSRHAAAIEFIQQSRPDLFGDAPVVAQATEDDVRGKVVAGNLPLNLAALAVSVWAVEFAGQPPRGAEYTITDMVAQGACLRVYTVTCHSAPPRMPRRLEDTYLGDPGDERRITEDRVSRLTPQPWQRGRLR